MPLSIRSLAIDSFVPMLGALSRNLDKGAAYAAEKKFDVDVLVKARLAPDMLPLGSQVRLACHHARDAGARLAGRAPVENERVVESFEQLKARIERTIAELSGIPAEAFDGAEERTTIIPLPEGDRVFAMNGVQFLRDWALPHFYFHVVTAYDILRHNGVDIGKRDFVANVRGYIRPRP